MLKIILGTQRTQTVRVTAIRHSDGKEIKMLIFNLKEGYKKFRIIDSDEPDYFIKDTNLTIDFDRGLYFKYYSGKCTETFLGTVKSVYVEAWTALRRLSDNLGRLSFEKVLFSIQKCCLCFSSLLKKNF